MGRKSREFSVWLTGTITPPATRHYLFGLEASGLSRLSVDGLMLIENRDIRMADREQTAEMAMVAGHSYALRVELGFVGEDAWRTFRLG